MDMLKICDIRHPEYVCRQADWQKWRLTYEGGTDFKEEYLEKFSSRETDSDFLLRKKISPIPAFAKAAINDIKNAIFQRVTDIKRLTKIDSYGKAILGQKGGVDRRGSTMNSFIGRKILPELLPLGKVGIYVDRQPLNGLTKLSERNNSPYLYRYKTEDILSWKHSRDSESDFTSLLLRDSNYEDDTEYGLPYSCGETYRYLYINDEGFVNVEFYDSEGIEKPELTTTLKLRKIPFVVMELTESLLADAADYQIAHLNLASSDINYGVRAGYPMYVEQSDMREMLGHLLQPSEGDTAGTATEASISKVKEVNVGSVTGRRYAKGNDPPSFIHPSSEPLKASMEKQEQLKAEIRLLVNLSLSSVKPKMASAESKSMDMEGLESGLSYIGLELEHGERRIAEHWAAYEHKENVEIIIKYPERYDLKSGEEKRKDADSLKNLITAVPSKTFRKRLAGQIAVLLLGNQISDEDTETILEEIESSPGVIGDPKTVIEAVVEGIMSHETAGKILGLPPGDVEKAAEEHKDRVLTLAAAQAAKQGPTDPGARGVDDQSANPSKAAKDEKAKSRDNTLNQNTKSKTRGEGK